MHRHQAPPTFYTFKTPVTSMAFAQLSKLWIPFLKHLLDGDFCKSFFDYHIFLFFWFSIIILSYTSILPMSQLQTLQLMTSQIRSHMEYLTQTNNILVLILYSNLMRNVAALAVFNTI